ncbi:Nif11-like leader peptide family RiPP precursor [Desulfovibrio sp. JC010]|uniref:Nif11-like leader peptide family RiPP precursor n=1 Tax=Desulfovibrio sp. JC010 TaxID=2593641 RepID=UPI0013D13386|nr:Nif11-like leader peptide family RiPP precursor [Desulfovibrio sp. JC010]NDV27679.1 Nif11-like leader peptide family natural product precursor [Desulfovibrio sp. JC010]
MSTESAAQWLAKLHENNDLLEKAKSATNADAWIALAKDNGFEFNIAEINSIVSALQDELSDNDLDSVAGGNYAPVVIGGSINVNGKKIAGSDVKNSVFTNSTFNPFDC